MDIYLSAFTKTLLLHMTLFYSMVCHSCVSGRVKPQFWRVTQVPKLSAFRARTRGSIGSGKLQTWGQAHGIPDCHIQSTSTPNNGFTES